MTYTTHTCEWEYGYAKRKYLCGAPLTEKVYNFSIRKYKKALCYGHQKQEELKTKPEIDYEERFG